MGVVSGLVLVMNGLFIDFSLIFGKPNNLGSSMSDSPCSKLFRQVSELAMWCCMLSISLVMLVWCLFVGASVLGASASVIRFLCCPTQDSLCYGAIGGN